MALVKYGSKQYSLLEAPAESSKVVVEQKKQLLGEIDLEALINDLSRAGKFVRVAYNGVAGNTDLQITVQQIGYDMTKLCNKAAITVIQFSRASHSVVLDLQSTYEYLMGGLEEMAVDTLGAVSKLAGDMALAAEELGKAFEKEEEKIEDTLMRTQREKGEEEKCKRQNEVHKKEKEAAIKQKDEAVEAEKRAEEAYRQAQLEEAENAGASAGLAVLSVLLIPAAPFTIAGAVLTGKKAREAKREKIRQLEIMKEQDDERKKALEKIATFAEQIVSYDARAEIGIGGDTAIDALHKAIGALKSLTVTMMRAADFWKKMEVHCKSIASAEMEAKLKKALEVGEKKIAIWASPVFKREALHFFARWVALECVCTTYSKKIKAIQEQLYKSIQENPTFEESRACIKAIAADLIKDIKKAHEDIEAEKAQKEKEIEECRQGK